MRDEDTRIEQAYFYNASGEVAGKIVDTTKENTERMMACWNACAGISTENLQSMPAPGVRGLVAELARLHNEESAVAIKNKALEAMLAVCDKILKHAPEYSGGPLEQCVKALLENDPSLIPGMMKHH